MHRRRTGNCDDRGEFTTVKTRSSAALSWVWSIGAGFALSFIVCMWLWAEHPEILAGKANNTAGALEEGLIGFTKRFLGYGIVLSLVIGVVMFLHSRRRSDENETACGWWPTSRS